MRNTFINKIHKAALKNKNIIFLTGDLGYSVIENFKAQLPEQVINVGIAEQNMIGLAAGLALAGKKVFVYSIIPFVTMRCLEQIRVDVCYQNLDVNIIGVGGGFAYGTLGATHHAIEDMAIMRSLPNMKIVSPADAVEADILAGQIISAKGPFYIRLNRGGEKNIYKSLRPKIRLGKGFILKKGKDISIISIGAITEVALITADFLNKEGISTEVVSIHSLKPIDKNLIKKIFTEKKAVFTLEEHTIFGGLGSAVAEIAAESGFNIPFKRIGVKDEYPKVIGKQDFLREIAGISPEQVAEIVKKIYFKKHRKFKNEMTIKNNRLI